MKNENPKGYKILVSDFKLANENFINNEEDIFLKEIKNIANNCKTFKIWNILTYIYFYNKKAFEIYDLLLSGDIKTYNYITFSDQLNYDYAEPRKERYMMNKTIADLVKDDYIYIDYQMATFVAKYINS